MNHEYFMRRCLDLAKQGRGLTGMNPLVGAVLVRDENILAEGWYRGVGTDHAEVDMIKKLDQTIQPKDRLYVNLEPCNHTGETPPCTQAIIDHGITHVVVGMVDPDKRVAGQGIAALREAGVAVTGPICRAECERLNRGFISVRTKGGHISRSSVLKPGRATFPIVMVQSFALPQMSKIYGLIHTCVPRMMP